jgi:hypothetical protein
MSSKKTQNAKEIIDRLKLLFHFKTDKELSDLFGITQSTLSSWRIRNSIPLKYIVAICDEENLNWVIYGEGTPEGQPNHHDITQKIMLLLEGMDDEKKLDVLRYAQEKKQFQEVIDHLEKLKAG